MQETASLARVGARAFLALALVVIPAVGVDAIFPLVSRGLEPLTTTRMAVHFEARGEGLARRAATAASSDNSVVQCNPVSGDSSSASMIRCEVVALGSNRVTETHEALKRIRAVDGLAAARATQPVNYVWGIAGAPILVYSWIFVALALAFASALGWRPLGRETFRKLFSKDGGRIIFLTCLPFNLKFLSALAFEHIFPATWRIGYQEPPAVEPALVVLPLDAYPMYFSGSPSEVEIPLSLYFLLAAPLAEELVFRAAVLRLLTSWYHPWVAIWLSALPFAAVHGYSSPEYTIQLLISGIALGWLWVRTRSLLLCVIAHALCNFVGVLKGIQAIDWSL